MHFVLIVLLVFCVSSYGSTHYASPDGVSFDGTLRNPMSLSFALSAVGPAQPGDSILLRGGRYDGQFSSRLSGQSNNPIVVKPYSSERAVINGTNETVFVPILSIGGSGTWFQDLEIMSSVTNRVVSNKMGGAFFDVSGYDNKLINCVIHDTGGGVFISERSTNAEVTGCIIYNNGWQGGDRGHGHGIYPQNFPGNRKVIRDNIVFHQYGYGIHAYGVAGHVSDFDFVGNVLFENGYLSSSRDESPGLLIQSGDHPSSGNTVSENIFYNATRVGSIPICYIGNQTPEINVTIQSNVFANSFMRFSWVTNAVVIDNVFEVWNLTAFPNNWDWYYPERSLPFTWDRNRYWNYQSKIVATEGSGTLSFPQWRATYPDYDVNGGFHGTVTNQSVYIRRNPYDTARLNVTVVNPSGNDNAIMNLGGLAVRGALYEVKNACDILGAVVKSGVYTGAAITLPMTNLTTAVPIGVASIAARGKHFNVFVVRLISSRMNLHHIAVERMNLSGVE